MDSHFAAGFLLSLSGVMYESPNQFRYPTPSAFLPKTARYEFDTKRVIIDKGVGNGAPKGGRYSGNYGGCSPSAQPQFRTPGGADSGRRGQWQRRINRNYRMGELSRNTGFVENEPGGRNCVCPEACRQPQRPGWCQCGNVFRYAHNDLELRPIKELAHKGKKGPPVRPSIRPSQLSQR